MCISSLRHASTAADGNVVCQRGKSTAPAGVWGQWRQGPCRPVERTDPMNLPPVSRVVPRFANPGCRRGIKRKEKRDLSCFQVTQPSSQGDPGCKLVGGRSCGVCSLSEHCL